MTKIRDPMVFFDVSIDGDPYEKMVFQLFPDVAPKIVENFRALCTGEMGIGSRSGKPLHYKGSFFHRIVRGSLAEGGDFVKRDGSSGESIYGSGYPDELPKLKHDQHGLLSMAMSSLDNLGSQFIITFKPNHSLDRKFVVFGKLVRGEEVLKRIEAAGDDDGYPKVTVKIVNCGEFKDGKGKINNIKLGKDNSSGINRVEGRKKDKQKKPSRDRIKKRKRYYSSDSVSSSEESELESSESDTSDSETDLSSSDDSSSYERHSKKKRSYKKDRHRRGRKRDSRKKRRRRDKKTKRRSRRSSDSSDDDSDSGSTSSDSVDDAKTRNDKPKASDQPKTNTKKEDEFPPVNGRPPMNGVDKVDIERIHRRPSPKKSTSRSLSISPKRNYVSPRNKSRSPIKPSYQRNSRRVPVRQRSGSPEDKPAPRRVSPRIVRSPIRREVSPSPTRIGRSVRRSLSRSPPRRVRSRSAGSASDSPDGSPKRIRRGRGFSDRFAYARRYRTPSLTRSPVGPRYSRHYRDRYSGYRRYSPKRFRSPPRRTPPRNRRSYSRSPSVSRSPRYRGGRRYSRSLSRSRSPAGGRRVEKNERRRSRSVSRSPSRSRSSRSRSPLAAGKRVGRSRSRSSSSSDEKKGLVSYDDGSP